MNQNKTANELTLEQVGQLFKTYENFPRPGILFYDIHPIMANAKARKVVIEHLYARYRGSTTLSVSSYDKTGF
jgi:adenine/guanine phosphoribosyltransferase-like PRPP-binding protein